MWVDKESCINPIATSRGRPEDQNLAIWGPWKHLPFSIVLSTYILQWFTITPKLKHLPSCTIPSLSPPLSFFSSLLFLCRLPNHVISLSCPLFYQLYHNYYPVALFCIPLSAMSHQSTTFQSYLTFTVAAYLSILSWKPPTHFCSLCALWGYLVTSSPLSITLQLLLIISFSIFPSPLLNMSNHAYPLQDPHPSHTSIPCSYQKANLNLF